MHENCNLWYQFKLQATFFCLFVCLINNYKEDTLVSCVNIAWVGMQRFYFSFKGCGMGTWLVLVSPCFWENVVATSKIGSFLCSLDNLLQKNVFALFFGYFKMALIWKKRLFLTYFSHFLVTREKLQEFLQHISHSHTYTYFAHPIDFFALSILKKKLSETVSLSYEFWCWFLFAPFWNNQ